MAKIKNEKMEKPEGYKTINEYAEEWGYSRPHAGELLRAALKKGLVEKTTVNGRMYYKEL